jgi:hypothetical protein
MPSLSLPFEMTQNSNTTSFSDLYHTPGLSANTSASYGTTSVSPSTPYGSSLLSPADLAYGPKGTFGTPGGPIATNPDAYSRLLHRYEQIERELTKEKEERVALK